MTIIGGGDVGLQLAERLEQSPASTCGSSSATPSAARCWRRRLGHTLVLQGDGTDLEFLESEDVGRSDVLVSVIDNDERNLLASLLGRQLGVPRIITRVSRPANLRLFERVGIDVALSARGAAVASILHQIAGGATSLLAVVEHGEARVFELTVSPPFEPRQLKNMGTPGTPSSRPSSARPGDRAAGRRSRAAGRPPHRSSARRRRPTACGPTSRGRPPDRRARLMRSPWSSTSAA